MNFRYWVREGDYVYPKSCVEVMFRGFGSRVEYSSGVYKIEPEPGQFVQAYCNFDRHGGGWTLLVNSSGTAGWDATNILERNSLDGTATEYSILNHLKNLAGADSGEVGIYNSFSQELIFHIFLYYN